MRKLSFLLIIFFLSCAFATSASADITKQGQVFIKVFVPLSGGSTPPAIFDFTPPQLSSIKIEDVTRTSAEISWHTDEETVFQLNYGKTREYGEVIVSGDFKKDFKVTLDNLPLGTLYHFEIVTKDKAGNSSSSGDYTFHTLPIPDETPPANVSDFVARAGDKEVVLTWKNPSDKDFLEIKIIRNRKFFPVSPSDGILVYQGNGEEATDENLTNGITYYYTAFSFDEAGNFSSGAIAFGIPKSPAIPSPPQPPIFPFPPAPSAPPVPEIEKLTLKDFDFYQAGQKLPLINGEKLKLKPEEPLRISINYEKVPEVLKTIIVSLGKEGKFFSFLLRINPLKTDYNAVLLTPKEAGVYSLTLTVLDYRNQALKKIQGQLIVEKPKEIPSSYPSRRDELLIVLNIFLGILILLLAFLIFLERKKINYF